jgi:hypothetical protein
MFIRYCSIRKLIVTVTADTCQYIIVVCQNGGVEHEKRHCRTRSYRSCPVLYGRWVFFLFFIILVIRAHPFCRTCSVLQISYARTTTAARGVQPYVVRSYHTYVCGACSIMNIIITSN